MLVLVPKTVLLHCFQLAQSGLGLPYVSMWVCFSVSHLEVLLAACLLFFFLTQNYFFSTTAKTVKREEK